MPPELGFRIVHEHDQMGGASWAAKASTGGWSATAGRWPIGNIRATTWAPRRQLVRTGSAYGRGASSHLGAGGAACGLVYLDEPIQRAIIFFTRSVIRAHRSS